MLVFALCWRKAGHCSVSSLLVNSQSDAHLDLPLPCRRSHHSAAAALQWPPPELAPAPLRGWHDGSTLQAVRAALHRLQFDAQSLLRMAEGELGCWVLGVEQSGSGLDNVPHTAGARLQIWSVCL